MSEITLKYGLNPNQKPARLTFEGEMPVCVLNGNPGYINFMDAMNSWQLAKELAAATGLPAASSFKHVSPAGAAVYREMDERTKSACFCGDGEISPIANAYIRARGADRVSSYGDFIALSECCDASTAQFIAQEVSDGIIAPDYTDEALSILKSKRKGGYNIIRVDAGYQPPEIERREIFGVTFEQRRNDMAISPDSLGDIVTLAKDVPADALIDLTVALITLKYTQSNSVCYAKNGMAIGVGAGQQNRINCVRLAGGKADRWWLRQSPQVLGLQFVEGLKRYDIDNAIDSYLCGEADSLLAEGEWQRIFAVKPDIFTDEEQAAYLSTVNGVSLGSDAFFPFGDSIERARKSGVSYVAQPGGSIRDDNVIETCNKYGIAMYFNGIRLFHH